MTSTEDFVIQLALDKGVITNDMFTALLLMAVGSTMLTVPIVTPKLSGTSIPARDRGMQATQRRAFDGPSPRPTTTAREISRH